MNIAILNLLVCLPVVLMPVETPAYSTAAETIASQTGGNANNPANTIQVSSQRQARRITNSIGMNLVRVPAGNFQMGSKYSYQSIQETFNEKSASLPLNFADEHPRHFVSISRDFYVGEYEVTVEQFRKFVLATGYKTDAERSGGAFHGFNPNEAEKTSGGWGSGLNWQNGNRNWPVNFVSWNDAGQFLTWLSKKEGARYRLPTEAEWEYFSRAGSTTLFFTGDQTSSLNRYANVPDATFRRNRSELSYATLPTDDGYNGRAPVGSFQPNRFGIYDVHGNVFEWCYDGYDKNAYSRHGNSDPYIRPETELRVIRGGCYM